MYRKFLWCYLFILTLLDISLNTKLTAQGESHGVTIHESLVEGITFQEWGKESSVDGLDGIVGSESIEGISLEPLALNFGRSALAAPHSRTVTLTNTANTTLHLASVAGTTPDFHASFFESKTLPPQGNTTFNVVYLGRREGPVSAHLYIHTSLGVHKYPVSAVGEASEYAVWPLLGLRVPLNATVEPELRLYNPTARTVQVREVYSSGAWLRLRLPGGGARAPRHAWAVPPRSERALVLLRAQPHQHAALDQPLVAYIRIKADIPGGGLVVAVEARAVAAGEHARPLHVHLGARGAGDAPYAVALEAANSGAEAAALAGGVRGAGCWRAAPPPPPCAAPAPAPHHPLRQNGAAAAGATLALERAELAPHQPFTRVATLTLNYTELWAGAVGAEGVEGAGEAWCAGCALLGRALVPFSVRLLPGALRFTPDPFDIVTATADALREHTLGARNEFARALRVHALHVPPELADLCHVEDLTPLTLRAGAEGALLRLRLRARPPAALALAATLLVHTDLTRYALPVRVYSGKLIFEWDWVNATSEVLDLGTVGTSWTRRVGVRLRNPAPAPLCAAALGAALPGAAATLTLAARSCVPPGGWAQAWLAVVAPPREALLRGAASVNTSLAASVAALTLRVRAGHVRALALRLPPAAPYASSSAELEVESSMSVRMRVTALEAAPPRTGDPALVFDWDGPERGEVAPGLQRAATVTFAPERRCAPRCYAGLDPQSEEGAAWARRGARWGADALRDDAALLQARLAAYAQLRDAAPGNNFTLHLHTTEVLQILVSGSARLQWPRLVAARAGAAALAAARRAVPLRLALRNPARTPLLLHALLAPAGAALPDLPPSAGGDSGFCTNEECIWSSDAFNLTGWRVTRGEAREAADAPPGAGALPALLLQPHAELELSVMFTPPDEGSFTTYLYLRNNLTILEGVQLYGQGALPRFDIDGKRPGSKSPFVFEVTVCSWGAPAVGGARAGGGVVSRLLRARNSGRVRVTLGGWSVARGGCEARGWRLAPCAPLALAPNASAPLHLAFTPDYTQARLSAPLHLQTDLGPVEYILMATIPANVLEKCAANAPRPPFEGMVRTMGLLLAFAIFVLALATAAIDAERMLRHARAARAPAPHHAPLDLRRLAPPAPPPPARAPAPVTTPAPAPAPARRPRRAARRPAPLDPRAERRAFERWRAEVLRRDDSERSSEDADEAPPAPPVPLVPRDRSLEPPLRDSSQDDNNDAEPTPVDEDGGSTGSDLSTPVEDRDDADEPYGGDVEPDPRDDSPTEICDTEPLPKPVVRPLASTPPAEPARTRVRRALGEVSEARRERARVVEAERRAPPARPHARRERPPRRRERPPSATPRSPAPSAEACVGTEVGAGAESGAEAGAEAAAAAEASARSWSAVVSGPPLAPIGSDVRRREPERVADNSLFYFNGPEHARADAEFAWRAPGANDRSAIAPHRALDETHALGVGSVGSKGNVGSAASVGSVSGVGGVSGGYGSVWGSGGWGAWGAGPLRPPPGFAPPTPPAQRTYDPFQSLAAIWAPAPHEWRPAPPPASPARAPPRPPPRDDAK